MIDAGVLYVSFLVGDCLPDLMKLDKYNIVKEKISG